MALTRKMLKALGLSEETIETIVDAHVETVTALTRERDELKTQAEAAQAIAKERDDLRAQADKAGDAAKVQAEFDAYRQQVEGEKTTATKTAAVRKALKAAGVARDEFAELLLGKVDMTSVELDGDSVRDPDSLVNPLRSSYAGCFGTVEDKGTDKTDPPSGGSKTEKDPFEKGFDA